MTIFDRIFRRTDDEDEYIYNRMDCDNRYDIDASTYAIRDVENTYNMVESTKNSTGLTFWEKYGVSIKGIGFLLFISIIMCSIIYVVACYPVIEETYIKPMMYPGYTENKAEAEAYYNGVYPILDKRTYTSSGGGYDTNGYVRYNTHYIIVYGFDFTLDDGRVYCIRNEYEVTGSQYEAISIGDTFDVANRTVNHFVE